MPSGFDRTAPASDSPSDTGRAGVGLSAPLPGGPAPAPLDLVGSSGGFREKLLALGNPCYACGARNSSNLRTCHECGLALPSGAPLPQDQAQVVVDRCFANRPWYQIRGFLSLGGATAFLYFTLYAIPEYFPSLDQTWDEFYLWTALTLVVLVLGMGYAFLSSRRAGLMTRVQVALYRRGSRDRQAYLAARRANSGTPAGAPPAPVAPLKLISGGAPLVPWTDRVAEPLARGGWLDQPTISFQPTLVFNGPSRGFAGRGWVLKDLQNRKLLAVPTDALASKVWQLSRSDSELTTQSDQFWGIFRGQEQVGRRLSEFSADDDRGTGSQRLSVKDRQGRTLVRWAGTFPLLPLDTRSILGAYQAMTAYLSEDDGAPVFRVSSDSTPEQISLVDSSSQKVLQASRTGTGWLLRAGGVASPDLPLLAGFLLLSWDPDGVSMDLARRLETDPAFKSSFLQAFYSNPF